MIASAILQSGGTHPRLRDYVISVMSWRLGWVGGWGGGGGGGGDERSTIFCHVILIITSAHVPNYDRIDNISAILFPV